jgi:hypothetical protein
MQLIKGNSFCVQVEQCRKLSAVGNFVMEKRFGRQRQMIGRLAIAMRVTDSEDMRATSSSSLSTL